MSVGFLMGDENILELVMLVALRLNIIKAIAL